MPQEINLLRVIIKIPGVFWFVDESKPMYYIQMA
jgi:hypothetical protein